MPIMSGVEAARMIREDLKKKCSNRRVFQPAPPLIYALSAEDPKTKDPAFDNYFLTPLRVATINREIKPKLL